MYHLVNGHFDPLHGDDLVEFVDVLPGDLLDDIEQCYFVRIAQLVQNKETNIELFEEAVNIIILETDGEYFVAVDKVQACLEHEVGPSAEAEQTQRLGNRLLHIVALVFYRLEQTGHQV